MKNLNTLLEFCSEPALIVDESLRIQNANSQMCELAGIEVSGLVNLMLREVIAYGSGSKENALLLNSPATGVSIKTRERENNGAVYHVNKASFLDEDAKSYLLTFYPSGKTEERELNGYKSEMLTLELILAGISHEINNPNSFISLNIPFLKEGYDKIFNILDRLELIKEKFKYNNLDYYEFKAEVYEVLNDMNVGSTRINDLVQEMKSFVLTDNIAGSDIIVLSNFIKSVVKFLRVHTNKKKIDVRVSCPEELNIAASKDYLTQILTNLIMNAADAVPASGGKIYITVSDSEGQPVQLKVADNGQGIGPSEINQIFRLFYTTKTGSGGIGMGLPVCKSLAEKMGFSLAVQSSLNSGTKVIMNIPREYKK